MPFIRLPEIEVIHKDLWNMQGIYRMVRQWLIENNYADKKDDTTMEAAMEILYWLKRGTPMDPNEREMRIWWRTQKRGIPYGMSSKFYVHHMDIDWHVIMMVDREIMRNGKKEKVQFGELRLMIKPYIQVGDIQGTPILKYFDYWFRTRLIKKNLEENRKILYQDAYVLQNAIKKYLEIQTYQPVEEPFHEKFDFI
jgi:hypothetical protein